MFGLIHVLELLLSFQSPSASSIRPLFCSSPVCTTSYITCCRPGFPSLALSRFGDCCIANCCTFRYHLAFHRVSSFWFLDYVPCHSSFLFLFISDFSEPVIFEIMFCLVLRILKSILSLPLVQYFPTLCSVSILRCLVQSLLLRPSVIRFAVAFGVSEPGQDILQCRHQCRTVYWYVFYYNEVNRYCTMPHISNLKGTHFRRHYYALRFGCQVLYCRACPWCP